MAHYYVRLNKAGLKKELMDDEAFGHPELGRFRDLHHVDAFGRQFVGGGGEVISEDEKQRLDDHDPDCCLEDGTPVIEVIGKVGEEDKLHRLIASGELG